MENGHQENSELNCEFTESDPYEKKYFCLSKKCASIQQSNERLVNRLIHIKKMLRRLRSERKFLMNRLDLHDDDYRETPLMLSTDSGMDGMPNLDMPATPEFSSSPLPSSNPSRQRSQPASTSKKRSRTEKDKTKSNAKQKPSSSFFQFSQEQKKAVDDFIQHAKDDYTQGASPKQSIKGICDVVVDEKKDVFEMYNGEKEMWFYSANEDLDRPVSLQNPMLK